MRQLACILLLAVLVAICGASANGRASAIDGDTNEIRDQRIQLDGVDAPESDQTCEAGGQTYRCGQQAALTLADHIGQRTVACEQHDTDRYRRIVAVCCIVVGDDIGAWLVSQGWALAYQRYSTNYVGDEEAVRLVGLGMWRDAFVPLGDWRAGRRTSTAGAEIDQQQSATARCGTIRTANLLAESGPGATGRFVAHTDGRFYDSAGKLFLPRGVNLFPDAASYEFLEKIGPTCWGFNFVRLNVLIENDTNPAASDATIDAFIDAYTAMGIVVMPTWHRTGGYGDTGAGTRAAILKFFKRLATKYKTDPYVWYGGYNEPGGKGDTTLVNGQLGWDPTRVARWVDLNRAIVETVRSAGATAPVRIPSMVLAQDVMKAANIWNYGEAFNHPLPARSAILSFGDQVRQGFDNTFFGVHLYRNYDQPDRQGPLGDFVAAMRARGWPLMFTEFGSLTDQGDRTQSSLNMHAVLAQHPHVGTVVWHGAHRGKNKLVVAPSTDEGVRYVNSCSDPTNLTRLGKIVWDGTHRAAFPPGSF